MISSRLVVVKMSGTTTRPAFGSRANELIVGSISVASRTRTAIGSTASEPAAAL